MRGPLCILASALSCLAPVASPAAAFVAPGATIASASLERLEQGDDSTLQVTISADGRYVVFQTRARNLFADDDPDPPGRFRVGGIFRRDLQTGALALVADGDQRAEDAPETTLVRGAQNPSVSSDGRFVAFATGQQLVPEDDNGNVDVYVRDMTLEPREPGAYDLVSARDGSTAPARYAPAPAELDRAGLNVGADVTPRAALSGDGRFVVFRTANVATDLPAADGVVTPGQQVLLRDRVERRTRLITGVAGSDPAVPVGGAVGAATISQDGSTLLWVGREAPSQTPFLDGEGANPALEYLLWKRIADGPGAPVRRVTGIADLDDPDCPLGASIIDDPGAAGPCYGPLGQVEGFVGGIVNQVPAMSADGRRIAFVTTASKRLEQSAGISGDLFVTEMGPGLARKAATVELTRDAAGDVAINGPVEGLALSPDGRWVVLSTFRTTFALPALRLTTPIRATPSVRELYLVDLTDRTIERLVRGYAGDDVNGSAGVQPSASADARRVAFTSSASNLFFGDANERSDAFVVDRLDAPPPDAPPDEPSADQLPEAPPPEAATPAPGRLAVTVRPGRAGAVRLRVALPGPGTLTAVSRGRLPDARTGRPSGSARMLARARRTVRRAGRVTIELRLGTAFRARLRAAGRITAQADLRFTPLSGRVLERRVTVQFRR